MKNLEPISWKQTLLPSLSLFTSLGTLLCCALPALLVTLGLGASLAGLVGSAPWITSFTEYKGLTFAISGVLIILAAFMQWQNRNAPCPADPEKAQACQRLRKMTWVILGISTVIYLIGFFFAFIAVHLFF